MNFIHSRFAKAREKWIPVSSATTFEANGMITPSEFIQAGDHLVEKFPLWKWQSGSLVKIRSVLPRERQYLVFEGVPYRPDLIVHDEEISNYDFDDKINSNIIGNSTQFTRGRFKDNVLIESMNREREPISELELYEKNDSSLAFNDILSSPDDIATVDVMITYDKYWRTPRLWLIGRKYNTEILSSNKLLSVLSSDHANQTITVETFPHFENDDPRYWMVSVHPCKHSEVIHKFMCQSRHNKSNTKPLGIDDYLIVFLKLMAVIMPTVEIDMTMDLKVTI